jgi:hypothetical protein
MNVQILQQSTMTDSDTKIPLSIIPMYQNSPSENSSLLISSYTSPSPTSITLNTFPSPTSSTSSSLSNSFESFPQKSNLRQDVINSTSNSSYSEQTSPYSASALPYTPFEKLKISLITYIINVAGVYDREIIYEMFDVKLLPEFGDNSELRKTKLPHVTDEPGAIISMVYDKDNWRGIRRKPFKNTTTFTMCLVDKNVGVGISNSKSGTTNIKIVGGLGDDHVIATINFINDKLMNAQNILDYMNDRKEKCIEVIEWMSKVIPSDGTLKYPAEIPENLDHIIASYFLRPFHEFHNWTDYHTFLQWIIVPKRIVEPDFKGLQITSVTQTMTNYNYDLGFQVNRVELAKWAGICTKFKPYYDNTTRQPAVKLTLSYLRDDSFSNIRKKKKDTKHTIQVHKSGKVTQSGPRPNLMEEVYNLFMDFVVGNRSKIAMNPDEVAPDVVNGDSEHSDDASDGSDSDDDVSNLQM